MTESMNRFTPVAELDPLKVPLAPLVQEILRTAIDGGPLPKRIKPAAPLSQYHLFITSQLGLLRVKFHGDNAELPLTDAVQAGIRPDNILGNFSIHNEELKGTFAFGRDGSWVRDGTIESYKGLIGKLTEQQQQIAEGAEVEWRGESVPLNALIMSHFWQRYDRDSVNNGPFGGDISQQPPAGHVYPSLGEDHSNHGIYDW